MNDVMSEMLFWDECALDPQVERNWICDEIFDADSCAIAMLAGVPNPETNIHMAVEIGCGIGRLTFALAEYLPDADILGVDVSECMVDLARKAKAERGNTNAAFVLNDGRTLPTGDYRPDFVYSMFVFQHLPFEAIESYCASVAMALKPGGTFRFQYIEGEETALPFHYIYPEAEMARIVERNGLTIIEHEPMMHEQFMFITARTAE